jgi:ASCH domain
MPAKRVLHLALEREWFDDIAEGKKRHEYRAYKEYWRKRLEGKEYDIVRFRNGYASDAPEMDVEFVGVRRKGKNYVIRLGRVLKRKRWRRRG